jgi:hypothetical protein
LVGALAAGADADTLERFIPQTPAKMITMMAAVRHRIQPRTDDFFSSAGALLPTALIVPVLPADALPFWLGGGEVAGGGA